MKQGRRHNASPATAPFWFGVGLGFMFLSGFSLVFLAVGITLMVGSLLTD